MLIAFNKPFGVICQFSDHEKYQSLANYINVPKVYPAGRLDTDSEGLLLLTDDGQLQAKISHPKYKQVKTYWAQVEGVPNAKDLTKFSLPINLGDFICQPAKAELINPNNLWQRNPPIRFRKNVADTWLQIKLNEGKNRQVRRMCAKVGFPCLRLIRVAIGKLDLMQLDLKLGQWCKIEPQDLF